MTKEDSPIFAEHSRRAKHALLAHYLPAWANVLGNRFDRLRFIDGFAHRGWYEVEGEESGAPGSPLVAIEAFRKAFQGKQPPAHIDCLFVERSPRWARELSRNLETKTEIPPWVSTEVRCGLFADEISRVSFENDSIIPTLVFIDPYGPTGFPLATVRKILAGRSTEVIVNLMWTRAGLNLAKQDMETTFDAMLESEQWRELRSQEPDEKREHFARLYMQALKERAGAKIVRAFEVYKGSQLEYWLIFATNNPKGWLEMKTAMWKVDTVAGARFLDTTDPLQTVLFEPEPNFSVLKNQLKARYIGKGPISIGSIKTFVLDGTAFLPKHLRAPVLNPMKDNGEIRVLNADGSSRRAKTYPEGTRVEFLAEPLERRPVQGNLFG